MEGLEPKWHSITIRLPWGVYERLKEMARQDKRKLATYVTQYLEVLADVSQEVKKP